MVHNGYNKDADQGNYPYICVQTMSELSKLREILSSYGSSALAFSGGLDSSFLLAQAAGCMPAVVAITIDTPYMPRREIRQAAEHAGRFNLPHHILSAGIADSIRKNPENRCYLCKRELFGLIIQKAKELGCQTIMDGTNASDARHLRPGMKALDELQIQSPLQQAGFTKEKIRQQARAQNLSFSEMPAYACLLTRLPHGTDISEQDLQMIEKAEDYLIGLNMPDVRVRKHGGIARVETGLQNFRQIIDQKEDISRKLKALGFRHITLDLEGYRTGSMDANHNDENDGRKA